MNLPTHARGERSEAGETLVEVVVAAALMAIVVVAIITGIGMVFSGYRLHRQLTDGNTVLVSAVERMKAVSHSQVDCSGSHTDAGRKATYQSAAAPVLPSGWTATVAIGYERLNGSTFDYSGTTCDSTMPTQQVTVTLTIPNSAVAPSVSFVKGDN
jgi:hypothetical protein